MADYPKELYQSKIYQAWNNMLTRCYNPNNNRYAFYKDISVCDKWHKFSGFYEDMSPTHKDGLSLDRVDNHGNYEPSNCRWATPKQQANNTRNIERARRYFFGGRTMTVREWAAFTGINRSTLGERLQRRGWPIGKALEMEGHHR